MNTSANYANVTTAAMFAAGWSHRLRILAGALVKVVFTTPKGSEETRVVSTGELPFAYHARPSVQRTRFGKTGRDTSSPTRGSQPTGRGAVRGPAKGPGGSVNKHGK